MKISCIFEPILTGNVWTELGTGNQDQKNRNRRNQSSRLDRLDQTGTAVLDRPDWTRIARLDRRDRTGTAGLVRLDQTRPDCARCVKAA